MHVGYQWRQERHPTRNKLAPMSLNLFRPPIFLTLVRRSCDWGVADPHCAKFGRSRSKGMSNYIDPPEKKLTPRIAPFKVTNIIKTDTD